MPIKCPTCKGSGKVYDPESVEDIIEKQMAENLDRWHEEWMEKNSLTGDGTEERNEPVIP